MVILIYSSKTCSSSYYTSTQIYWKLEIRNIRLTIIYDEPLRRGWGYQRESESVNRRTDHTMVKKDKRTNNDLQSTIHKTKDRLTRIILKTGDEAMCSGRVSSSCSTSGTRRVNLVTKPTWNTSTYFWDLVASRQYKYNYFTFETSNSAWFSKVNNKLYNLNNKSMYFG